MIQGTFYAFVALSMAAFASSKGAPYTDVAMFLCTAFVCVLLGDILSAIKGKK